MFEFKSVGNLSDYFGSVYVKEEELVTIGGFSTEKFLLDLKSIWGTDKVSKFMFNEIRPYRVTCERFFLPDILYIFEQIRDFKKRKSNKYRVGQVIEQLRTNTWLKSMFEKHDPILDFTQLDRLHFTPKPHQIETLEAYNDKVPRMLLRGFLMSTPPGLTHMGLC